MGGEAYPVVSTEVKYPSLQVGINMSTVALPSGTEYAYIGLQEGLIKFACQEKMISINQLGTKICSFCSGTGSTAIIDLSKGTSLYNALLNSIRTAYNNAKSQNPNAIVKVPAITYI